ncbi:MAG TPA: hypothetical protein VF593_09335 [Chthoniobacteraceae bacterium]
MLASTDSSLSHDLLPVGSRSARAVGGIFGAVPRMRMLAQFLAFLLSIFPMRPASAQLPAAPDARETAKREAWSLATLIVSLLEQGDNSGFPGVQAWIEEFHRIEAGIPAADSGKPFPQLNADELVSRNPRFWTAYFEIPPGDPGLALLHSSLLLCSGEAQRAAALAAIGLQRGTVPEEFKRGLATIISQAQAAQERSFALVRAGVKLHDERNFAGALRQYEEAIADWPANGWAHYELGFTLRMKAIAEAGKPLPSSEAPRMQAPAIDPPQTRDAFSAARRHDPFQIMAYQGDEPEMLAGLMALVRTGLPAWEAIRRHPDTPVSREQLRDLAEACRTAGIDEYALALRQLLVARAKRYQSADEEFLSACLQRLAPGVSIQRTLLRLSSDPLNLARQIVAPPPPPDPPQLASVDSVEPEDPEEPAVKPKSAGGGKKKASAKITKTTKKKTAATKKPTSSKKTASTKGKKRKRS